MKNLFISIVAVINSWFGVHNQTSSTQVQPTNQSAQVQVSQNVQSNISANTNTNPSNHTPTLNSKPIIQNTPSGKPIQTQTVGTLEGKATLAADCNISACNQTPISSLGILIRKPTTEVQSDGSMAITIKDLKYNMDGTYSIDLSPGTYYVYEDNSDWRNTSLTAQYSGDVTSSGQITIKAGAVTHLNFSIDNIKPNLPL